MSKGILLRNGRVIDPKSSCDEIRDLWVVDGMIAAPGSCDVADLLVVDVDGKWVVPGLIDMHVHLREPGEEYKETIASGCRAAAAGGFTAVACMPNTTPVNDCGSVTRFIMEKAESCDARVYPVGAISKGSAGKCLAEFAEMKEAGAVAFTDDGLPVVDSQLMRRALEYADSYHMVIISHAEEPALGKRGSMNEGRMSVSMGLKGIPNAAESIMVHRDISLSALTGARVHIAHVSCRESVELIRQAKARGVNVTAESAPHYFSLTEEAVSGYNTNAKMNPPLRSLADMQAIREGLADGTLDAIATDHAPHSQLEKELEFDRAANGITGLETSLPLAMTLVQEGILEPSRMVELMSCGPADILGIPGGGLKEGSVADITVIDPQKRFTYTVEKGKSLGRNSPFDGREFTGQAVCTILGGKIVSGDL